MTKQQAANKVKKYREWAKLAKTKLEKLEKNFYEKYKNFDWSEPIKKDHYSASKHQKHFDAKANFFNKCIELENKIKNNLDKAENLEIFSQTNKGDAEKRRQEQREHFDKFIKVGSFVKTVYGIQEVIKINKKTYTLKNNFGDQTIDKSFILEIL